MRWERLFDELEHQLETEGAAEHRDLEVEENRLRFARLTLSDRIRLLAEARAGSGRTVVRVLIAGGIWLRLRPHAFGSDWLAADILPESLDDSRTAPGAGPVGAPSESNRCILPLTAIAAVGVDRRDIRGSLAAPSGEPDRIRSADRIGLVVVLRDLSRRRTRVELMSGGSTFVGTIDRVGRDHLDLAVHEADAPRRESAVHRYLLLPIAGVGVVRF